MSRLPWTAKTRRNTQLALARYRRLLAAGLLAGGTALGLQAIAPEQANTPVWTATRDLPLGQQVTPEDFTQTPWPGSVVPDGTITPPDTAVLSGAMRRGEPLTDSRLLDDGLLIAQPAGTLATPLRLADPAVTTLIRPGDRIDLISTGDPDLSGEPADPRPGTVITRDCLVLAVPGKSPDASPTDENPIPDPLGRGTTTQDSGLVVLALPDQEAVTAAHRTSLAVSIRTRQETTTSTPSPSPS